MVRSALPLAFILTAIPLRSASAAPPPPPPSYVTEVAALLTANEGAPQTRIADLVADDVKVFVNDRKVAQGKRSWLRYASHQPVSAGLLGYSEGRVQNGGVLAIVDQFDTIDGSNLPKTLIADPRFDTRSTLYEFGADAKIHAIRMLVATGFWIKP